MRYWKGTRKGGDQLGGYISYSSIRSWHKSLRVACCLHPVVVYSHCAGQEGWQP